MASDVLADLPESADRYEFNAQDGDVIVMATDGIFDNVPDSILVAEISTIQGSTDPAQIQVFLKKNKSCYETFVWSSNIHMTQL